MATSDQTFDWIKDATVPSRLLQLRDLHPSRMAMVTFDRDQKESRITFQELATKASRFAHVLRTAGFTRNDVMANTLPVSVERLVTDLGLMMAGMVGVGARASLSQGHAFFSMVTRCDCKGVIVSPDLDSTEWQLIKDGLVQGSKVGDLGRIYQSTSAPQVKTVLIVTRGGGCAPETLEVPELMSYLSAPREEYLCDVRPDELAYIYYTSGSTGLPKLYPRSHKSLLQCAAIISDVVHEPVKSLGYRDKAPVLWNNHPLDLLAGFPLMVYSKGGTRVCLDQLCVPADDPFAAYWHAMETCRVQMAHLTALEIEGLLRSDPDVKYKLPVVFVGGMPLTASVVKAALRTAQLLGNHYGSAEMASVCSEVYDREEDFEQGVVGTPVKGCQVRIVDNVGTCVTEGEVGHIEVKSNWLVQDYIGDPGQRLQSFTEDGWFKSGDMGFMTSQGRLKIAGRSDDAILSGPYTIFPHAIENTLAKCPGVNQVAVVPVPDPTTNHKLCACVIRSPHQSPPLEAEELVAFMRGQLSNPPNPYTPVPDYVLFMSEFPLALYSKVNRKKLATSACQILMAKKVIPN